MPIEPGLVGNRRRIILGGEYVGPFVVKAKAKELGIDVSDEELDDLLNSVREKLQGRKTPLKDEEFLSIIQKAG